MQKRAKNIQNSDFPAGPPRWNLPNLTLLCRSDGWRCCQESMTVCRYPPEFGYINPCRWSVSTSRIRRTCGFTAHLHKLATLLNPAELPGITNVHYIRNVFAGLVVLNAKLTVTSGGVGNCGFIFYMLLGGPRAFLDPPRPLCFWFSSVTDLKLTPSSQSGDM